MNRLFLLLILSSSSFAMGQSLQEKFTQALKVVAVSTAHICYSCRADVSMSGDAAVAQSYENQEVYQQIRVQVTSPAQQLLLDVSDTIQVLAGQLIFGTQNPSETRRLAACSSVKTGMDQRRFAPFYEGYNDLHPDFVAFLNQFQTVASILSCDLW